MACTQTLKGIILDCETSVGGIKEVYIAHYEDVKGVTVGSTIKLDSNPEAEPVTVDSNPEAEPVTLPGDMITAIDAAGKFERYQFRKQTGSMTSTLNVDEVAGINYVSTELSLVFTKMETKKRVEIAALAVGQLAVIVKDGNNKFWFLGFDDYVSSTAGSGNTGTAKGDSNNYSITLKDESDSYPYEVHPSIIEALIAK